MLAGSLCLSLCPPVSLSQCVSLSPVFLNHALYFRHFCAEIFCQNWCPFENNGRLLSQKDVILITVQRMCAVLPIFLFFFFQRPPEGFCAVTFLLDLHGGLSTSNLLSSFKKIFQPDGLMAFD